MRQNYPIICINYCYPRMSSMLLGEQYPTLEAAVFLGGGWMYLPSIFPSVFMCLKTHICCHLGAILPQSKDLTRTWIGIEMPRKDLGWKPSKIQALKQ